MAAMDATDDTSSPINALDAAAALWREAGLPPAALAHLQLPGREPVLPSSFALATALQASLGAAALAAAEIGLARGGPRQQVSVGAEAVAAEASAHFSVDGRVPAVWDKLSGLYRAADGWLRLHANFAHHRDGALRLLGLPPGDATERVAVADALGRWRTLDFEQAAADAGLVVAAARRLDEWDAHPQAAAVAAQSLLSLQRLDGGPPQPWAPLPAGAPPLQGLRVLDLTRILAGPTAGRVLAAYGADVMLVNSPQLPNIESIADTSRGKLSAHVDLKTMAGREQLRALLRDADVFLHAYRPGALAALGFDRFELQRLNPGLVDVALSAYGDSGPWAGRRGFDSLVQTATGFNLAEAEAFGSAEPRAFPLQVLDYSGGFLLAFAVQAALLRRAQEGGFWQARLTLARTALWLRSLGRLQDFQAVAKPSLEPHLETLDSGFGRLCAVRHAARFSHTPLAFARPSMPPGTHAPVWPPR
jgi:crotonobetainyl-CoA:carnitine CoA-transferase CaiB-like acyl-CoA transferase